MCISDRYIGKSYYIDNTDQRIADILSYISNPPVPYKVIGKDIIKSNQQLPLPYRYRLSDKNNILDQIIINKPTDDNLVGTLELKDGSLVLKSKPVETTTEQDKNNSSVFNSITNKTLKYDDPTFIKEFKYSDTTDFYKYADIKINSKDDNKSPVKNSKPNTDFTDNIVDSTLKSKLFGAILYPQLTSSTDLLCSKYDKYQYTTVDSNKDITIPLIMEYMFEDTNQEEKYVKTLAFDIRPALLKEIEHYIVSITVNKKYTL